MKQQVKCGQSGSKCASSVKCMLPATSSLPRNRGTRHCDHVATTASNLNHNAGILVAVLDDIKIGEVALSS